MRAAFFGSLEATYSVSSLGFRCIYDGAPAPALRGDATSLHDLPLPALNPGRGHVTLVSMFYASCPAACPILIGELQQILAELGDHDVHVVLSASIRTATRRRC